MAPITTSGKPSQSLGKGSTGTISRGLFVASRAGVSLGTDISAVWDSSGLPPMGLGQESGREGEVVS